jgi:hypothetical protein
MNEEEWLTSDDPVALLIWANGQLSARKQKLFEVSSARLIQEVRRDETLTQTLDFLELMTDNLPVDELSFDRLGWAVLQLSQTARQESLRVFQLLGPNAVESRCAMAWDVATSRVHNAAFGMEWSYWFEELQAHGPPQTYTDYSNRQYVATYSVCLPLLRCIAGNPFRPVTVNREWFTSTVVDLARGIYNERAFDRLPILADALQDASCDNDDILTHCRGPGPHARGCWVVDLVLGKG